MPLICNTRTKNIFLNEQKVGILLQKRTDTRGVEKSNMRESIYLLTTTPTSHTHIFHPHPPPANDTHTFHPLPLATSGWNLWVWLLGVVVRRYIDFLILLIYPYSSCIFFAAASLLFVHLKKCVLFLFQYFFVITFYVLNNFFAQYKHTYGHPTAAIRRLHILFYT